MKYIFCKPAGLLLGLILLLSGCSFLPTEEVYPAAPVIQAYETQEYTQTPVLRGDLILTKSVICRYIPVRKEALSFSLGGEVIQSVYVTKGQVVSTGDLLIELAHENMTDQIDELEFQIQILSTECVHTQELWNLALKRLNALYPQQDDAYLTEKSALDQTYSKQLQTWKDALYLEELKLEEARDSLSQRQLRAAFDGTVTSLKTIKEGQRSVKDEVLITISDMNTTVFTVSGSDASYFPVGTSAIITLNGRELPAVSIEAPVSEVANSSEPTAYLQLLQPDPTLESGISGRIQVTLASSTNTLYVDRSAIKTANGRTFVYVLNEDGLRVMQNVTVGLECNNYIEILSGLDEGDSVVLDR